MKAQSISLSADVPVPHNLEFFGKTLPVPTHSKVFLSPWQYCPNSSRGITAFIFYKRLTQIVNFSADNITLKSTFVVLKTVNLRNSKNSKITDEKIHKIIHLVS